jgi:hypothetical protein
MSIPTPGRQPTIRIDSCPPPASYLFRPLAARFSLALAGPSVSSNLPPRTLHPSARRYPAHYTMTTIADTPLLSSLPSGVSLHGLSVLLAAVTMSPTPAQSSPMVKHSSGELGTPFMSLGGFPTGLSVKSLRELSSSALGAALAAADAHSPEDTTTAPATTSPPTVESPPAAEALSTAKSPWVEEDLPTTEDPAAVFAHNLRVFGLAQPPVPKDASPDASLDYDTSADSSLEAYAARSDGDARLIHARRLTLQPSQGRLVPSSSMVSLAAPAPAPPPSPTLGGPVSLAGVHSALAYVSASLGSLDAYATALTDAVTAGTARRDALVADLARARADEARERQMARWARTMPGSCGSISTLASRRTAGISADVPAPAPASALATVVPAVAPEAVVVPAVVESTPSAPGTPPTICAARVFSREGLEPLEHGTIDGATGLWRLPSLSGPAAQTRAIAEGVRRRLVLGRRMTKRSGGQ